MEEQIKLLDSLSREKKKLRQGFLVDRDKRIELQKAQEVAAKPIVEPIVNALNKTIKSETPILTKEELTESVSRIQHYRDWNDRRGFVNSVQEMHSDDNLFNVFLSIAKMGAIENFPIAKMKKLGIVDSLIFYGTGGTNLDHLHGVKQTSEYKDRLSNFNKFYLLHSNFIKGILENGDDEDDELQKQQMRHDTYTNYLNTSISKRKSPSTPVSSSDEEEASDDEDTYYESEGDNTLVEGSGLVDRLALLHASKNAGNTSERVLNEASSILKRLLKRGKISKTKYVKLATLFQ